MKWLIVISFFIVSLACCGQIYHESPQGDVQVLGNDSTTVIVKFHTQDFVDVSENYDYINGLRDKLCYKYEWVVDEGKLIDRKGLLVIKMEDGEIYTVWLYESSKDGKSTLSRMLERNFN